MDKGDWFSLIACIAATWFAAAVLYRFRIFGVPVLIIGLGTVLWATTRGLLKRGSRHDRAA
jgi:hypothetical protein